MDAAALLGLCAVLARQPALQHHGADPRCRTAVHASPPPLERSGLGQLLASAEARAGIARVAYAEAGNQGDSGLAGVIYTILNRLQDGGWGPSVDAVLNARGQFEPVLRAGGDWRRLAPVSAAQQARVDTILNLALDGRLPDLTHGARYFQNPVIVARRAQAGSVSPDLVGFGASPASAVIGAHSFYVSAGRGGGSSARPRSPARRDDGAAGAAALFVGKNRGEASAEASPAPDLEATWDPSHALFFPSLNGGAGEAPR